MTLLPFTDEELRLAPLGARAYLNEMQQVTALRTQASFFDAKSAAITARATRYVQNLRASGKRSGIEEFQHEYGLGSHEGIMIMCLAEALLRIPDTVTADALIHDKLSHREWDRHTGLGRPWGTRAGALGLELAGAISDRNALALSAGEFIGGLIHRLGEPVVRSALKHAMRMMGGAFVIGADIEKAKRHAKAMRGSHTLFSFDMLGEAARSADQAEAYFARYMQAIGALGNQKGALYRRDGISIKLSALHPRFELRNWTRLKKELLPQLIQLLQAAAAQGIPVTVDAEEATRLDVTLLCFAALLRSVEIRDYEGLGIAVQAYQKRASDTLDWLAQLAQSTGKRIAVRLVKGAYWDGEIKRAQELGLPGYPVFTRKAHTDISYLACAAKLLAQPEAFYPQFATHNARTIAAILETAGDNAYEFQRLWGMGEGIYDEVSKGTDAPLCRIYAPVGEAKHLLSYLIRRILENGANGSFVKGLWSAPVDELLADPIASTRAGSRPALPLPDEINPGRTNSRGYDTGNLGELYALWQPVPAPQTAPCDTDIERCTAAFERAQSAFALWRGVTIAERALKLESVAGLYVRHERELLSLLMDEGKKTLADSIAEVREAIDYCRYYAQNAHTLFESLTLSAVSGEHNSLNMEARGIFVAISPWNFPLAIFTGQIVAALVTGNTVIAKPAEQTPRIAAYAVGLMHEAGIPAQAVQLLCGRGETVGQALVAHPACAGVVFTGSTAAALAINRTLAAREGAIATLIAETGGQNCMIVDSSALIEQADDIVLSAFGSAGQRCSALRIVYVQEEIADTLIEVLAGAMMQLRVGAVDNPATDIGPVIDHGAYDNLMHHIDSMKVNARLIAATPLPEKATIPLLVAPHVFEISSIGVLQKEIFGPVLHVIRWCAGTLDEVIAQINSTGYGLTFGIHSRIDEHIRYACALVQAGNIYVNRSIIGAAVGMQPFGGHGLSGTGPKAGGPHYLQRFCRERTICVNSAAVGGNVELLT